MIFIIIILNIYYKYNIQFMYDSIQYNKENKVVEEIKSGVNYSQFIIGRNLPFYEFALLTP